MPKIIDDLNTCILKETKKQVFEKGYKDTTIRSVAIACGIASGTIYNYYSSKEAMVAALVLKDWMPVYERMEKECERAVDLLSVYRIVYQELLAFREEYQRLFVQDAAIRTASSVMSHQHPKFRMQLASLMDRRRESPPDFTAEFLAEAFIAWSSEGRPFTDLEPIVKEIVH